MSITGVESHIPWVEKYRPERVEDISHQDEVTSTLKSAIAQGSIPHLMFYGPPGTGKTTTALALARELYGPELYRARTLELNASDERGIKVVREKIKTFAQGAVGQQKHSGYPCPRFKLIILDEADTMTPEAQSALRRIMEAYSKVTRFCLICNYVTRIIEPLASRCAKFRFKALSVPSMILRLQYIADTEGVKLGDGVLDALLEVSEGDMRKAVTYLQSAHDLSAGSSHISHEMVLDVSGQICADVMTPLWSAVLAGSPFDVVKKHVADIVAEGYDMTDILWKLHDDTIRQPSFVDTDKALICEKIAQ
ncbi:RFC2, partial [Symbiodinium microadriaticum]